MSSCAAAIGPRDPIAAARVPGWIMAGCAVVETASAVLGLTPQLPGLVVMTIPVVLAAILFARPATKTRLLYFACPLLGVALVTMLDLTTHDATASGEALFILPLLYGASALRTSGAAAATAATLMGTTLVSLTQAKVWRP